MSRKLFVDEHQRRIDTLELLEQARKRTMRTIFLILVLWLVFSLRAQGMPEWVPGVKQAETLENWAIYLAGIGTAFVLWQLLRRYWLYMLVLGVLLLGIAAFIAVL